MMMQMVGVFAEFEREIIRERTHAGLERARKKGRYPGRKPKLSDDQRQEIRDMVRSGKRTEAEAARIFGVHRSTISRIMREALSDPIT
jgi:DNA invertase Pin-like site-specific DNA recombinase